MDLSAIGNLVGNILNSNDFSNFDKDINEGNFYSVFNKVKQSIEPELGIDNKSKNDVKVTLDVTLTEVLNQEEKKFKAKVKRSDGKSKNKKFKVKLEKHFKDGEVVTYIGEGNEDTESGIVGDLLININVKNDTSYMIDSKGNLHYNCYLTLDDYYKEEKEIKTIYNTVEKILCTEPTHKLKEMGLPNKDKPNSDLNIKFGLKIPVNGKELLFDFKKVD